MDSQRGKMVLICLDSSNDVERRCREGAPYEYLPLRLNAEQISQKRVI